MNNSALGTVLLASPELWAEEHLSLRFDDRLKSNVTSAKIGSPIIIVSGNHTLSPGQPLGQTSRHVQTLGTGGDGSYLDPLECQVSTEIQEQYIKKDSKTHVHIIIWNVEVSQPCRVLDIALPLRQDWDISAGALCIINRFSKEQVH